jgi:hypothetical protein
VEAWHAYPDGPNAAEAYVAITVNKEPAGVDIDQLPIAGLATGPGPGEPLTEAQRKAAEAYLAANATVLTELHEAAGIESSRYPVRYDRGFNMSFPNLGRILAQAKLLAVEALACAADGDAAGASEAIVALAAVARSMKEEPRLFAQLVHMAMAATAAGSVEDALPRVRFTDDQLARMEEALAGMLNPRSMEIGLVGERVILHDLLGDPAEATEELADWRMENDRLKLRLYRLAGMWDYDHAAYLQWMGDYIKAASRPTHERLAALRKVQRRVEALPDWRLVFGRASFGGVRANQLYLRSVADVRNARAAMAVERYRLAHGGLPAALGDLVPGYLDPVLKDPYTGDPLKYKPGVPKAGAYTIYSIGGDKTDHGGRRTNADGDEYQDGADIPIVVGDER